MTKIFGIQAFTDNYIWILVANDSSAIVVDPGEALPVLEYLKGNQVTLAGIFVTHHHHDHTGGIAELLNHKNVPVYGGWKEPVSHLSKPLKEGDVVHINSKDSYSILEIPGHTLGHIAFVGEGRAFTGDTLFTAGCGRTFEGTAAQMLNSLNKIKSLPSNTDIFCGHEYTLANLRFARVVEPENKEVESRFAVVQKQRDNNMATVPATLEIELKTNPFLRTNQPSVILAAEHHAGKKLNDEVEVFAVIRQWKDGFR